MKRYPRTELARSLTDELEGLHPFGDARNGLFPAAPRRTGKSTFPFRDLSPELALRGHQSRAVSKEESWNAPLVDAVTN